MRIRMLVASTAIVVLGGCAGLPESGPVERVAAAGSRTHSTVRYEPARPRDGATPQQIVAGYLDAMLAYPEATGIVQSYLTPQAIDDWKSGLGMTVYSRVSTSLGKMTRNSASIALRTRDVLTIDAAGRASVKATDVTRALRTERVDGQWRVANPVPGYLVSQRFADGYLRSYPLWFFDESGERLVPELVHAVVSEQLPLVLMRRLAGGPRLSTLRTYVPRPNQLKIRVKGKIVEVDFTGATEDAPDRVTAQLLSTLRGVPGIDGLHVLVNGVLKNDVQTDAVVGFGPGPQPTRVYAVRADRIVDVTKHPRQIPGPWGRSAHGAIAIAVDTGTVAAVSAGRRSVVIGSRKGGERSTIDGIDIANPVWDDVHDLWIVDHPGVARIRVVHRKKVTEVPADGLGTVQSFAISPDRSRYAAIVRSGNGADVVVGAITYDAAGQPRRLFEPRVVSHGISGERSVGWASQSRVEFVASGGAGLQLYAVGADGADLSRGSALRGGVAEWAGAPADRADRWALDGRGQLWRRESGGVWQLLASDDFHALTAGR